MKLYRALAAILILIGLYLVTTALRDAFTTDNAYFPIRCNSDDCRVILSDGTLGGTVARPEGVTK